MATSDVSASVSPQRAQRDTARPFSAFTALSALSYCYGTAVQAA